MESWDVHHYVQGFLTYYQKLAIATVPLGFAVEH